MAAPATDTKQGADCNIPNGCDRIFPAWIIAMDNAPTAMMFLLGTAVVWETDPLSALLFLAYCFLSILLFWKLICPWCQHFGKAGCPCGYGRIAKRLFKRKTDREFRNVFRRNIYVVFPCWLVPLGVGFYRILTDYSQTVLFLLLSFSFVGFILVPVVSRFAGCRSCGMKQQCPWISDSL